MNKIEVVVQVNGWLNATVETSGRIGTTTKFQTTRGTQTPTQVISIGGIASLQPLVVPPRISVQI